MYVNWYSSKPCMFRLRKNNWTDCTIEKGSISVMVRVSYYNWVYIGCHEVASFDTSVDFWLLIFWQSKGLYLYCALSMNNHVNKSIGWSLPHDRIDIGRLYQTIRFRELASVSPMRELILAVSTRLSGLKISIGIYKDFQM